VHVSARLLSLLCLYSKVEDDVSVAVYLDDVLQFRVNDHRRRGFQSLAKFQRQAYAALSHQAKVVVFAQIGRQVERVQAVFVCVFIAGDEQLFVGTQFARSGKDGVVRSYILSGCKVWLDWFQGVLLLTVQV